MTTSDMYLFFWGHNRKPNDPWKAHVFSNWAAVSFRDTTGAKFCSTEQYMMVEKTRLFLDADPSNHTILGEMLEPGITPGKVKELGRCVQGFSEEVWVKHRERIVMQGLKLKFSQNNECKAALMQTQGLFLVEASPQDHIWGIGIDARTACGADSSRWPGLNLLGKLLTQCREELRVENPTLSDEFLQATQVTIPHTNPPEVARGCLEILAKMVARIIEEPMILKFRLLRMNNENMQMKVLTVNGAVELLEALEFKKTKFGHEWYFANTTVHDLRVYGMALTTIERQLDNMQPTSPTSAPPTTATPSAPSEHNMKMHKM
eukprot:TRINITY_DN53978_c0_g1_i1.p1 TRINITY_DN53978_c0_g1~~TRINITY_DN53978_c0_g1_i1.p1  ORF type:complete len:332 (+),score=27.53 TRINITY_DN53978_c0_g1_i1:40-996(+)